MPAQINAFGNCQTEIMGTGVAFCDPKTYGDFLGLGVQNKGTSFAITNGSVAFDATVAETLIKERKLHQLIDRLAFTQDTAENEVFTDGIGLERSIREGKTKLSVMYARSIENAKSLHSLKGDKRWDGLLYFTNGVLLTTDVTNTKAKGFDFGRFDVSTVKFLVGTDEQQVSVMFQMTRPEELNERALFITWEQLGIDLSQKDGVIDCDVKVVTPPIVGGTTMSIKLTSKANTSSVLLGFDDILDWATGGVQTTPKLAPSAIAFNSSTELYDLTFASAFVAGDTYQPRLRTLTLNVATDAIGNNYAGRAVLGTV